MARVSGHPLLPRYGRTHTLNHKRVARTVAQELQPFANVLDQADYRAGVIARCLEQAVLSGQVDAIVLTGGVIYSQAFRQLLLSRHLLSGPGDLQARRGGDGQPGLLPQRRPHRRAPAQGI